MCFCHRIEVVLHRDGSVRVIDDGRGIPVEIHETVGKPAVEVVLTRLHAGGKFGGAAYRISGGLHGVGVSVVNALSEWLEVEIYREGKIWKQRYERGNPQGELQEIGTTDRVGTMIHFKPDPVIFLDTTFHSDVISQRLKELAFLNPGLTIVFRDEEQEQEKTYHFEGGIRALVSYLNKRKEVLHPEPIYFEGEKEGIKVEVALQYNEDIWKISSLLPTTLILQKVELMLLVFKLLSPEQLLIMGKRGVFSKVMRKLLLETIFEKVYVR
jgi:DNA gyrase subunit B